MNDRDEKIIKEVVEAHNQNLCCGAYTVDLLRIINRLEANINHLENESDALLADIDFRDEENKTLQAENERLKEEISVRDKIIDERGAEVIRHDNAIRSLHKQLETAKFDAYKELAEKLQDRCIKQQGCLYASDIGAELNELIGDK